MRKYFTLLTVAAIVILGITLLFSKKDTTMNYVIFASSQHLNEQLRESLINRLETNNITYQIDADGNVKLLEKDVKKAIMCCS